MSEILEKKILANRLGHRLLPDSNVHLGHAVEPLTFDEALQIAKHVLPDCIVEKVEQNTRMLRATLAKHCDGYSYTLYLCGDKMSGNPKCSYFGVFVDENTATREAYLDAEALSSELTIHAQDPYSSHIIIPLEASFDLDPLYLEYFCMSGYQFTPVSNKLWKVDCPEGRVSFRIEFDTHSSFVVDKSEIQTPVAHAYLREVVTMFKKLNGLYPTEEDTKLSLERNGCEW